MRGAFGCHFSWQVQCLVNLDDALKGPKSAFCETVVEFDSGHDDDDDDDDADAFFVAGAVLGGPLQKSGCDPGKTLLLTFSMFIFRGARSVL